MKPKDIIQIFQKISHLRVGVIGDFAVDFYFEIQKKTNEISVETQKVVFWAKKPRTSLGGAGNIVQNLVALGIENIKVFGCVGNDIFGREMLALLENKRVDISAFQILSENWDTCTYTKPMTKSGEDNRLDFGTNNLLSEKVFDKILSEIEKSLPNLDVFIINQQFPNPLLNQIRLERLNVLVEKFPQVLFVADARNYGLFVRNSILKVNTAELAKMLNIAPFDEKNEEICIEKAKELSKKLKCPILQTRGENGILYANQDQIELVEGINILGEIDTVGAGDTVVAAFSSVLGTKTSIKTSLIIANFAAAITVQKLHQTGTANLEEILEIFDDNFPKF